MSILSNLKILELIESVSQRLLSKKTMSMLLILSFMTLHCSRVVTLHKLTSPGIYSILISKVQNKPSSNIYFENLSNDYNIDWAAVFMPNRLTACNTYMRSVEHKT